MRRLVLLVALAVLDFGAPAAAQPVLTERAHEETQSQWKGPSGYWTNPHPTKGGAYRWRMMAIGGGLLVITGFVMLRLVKRANAERNARK
jgi:hypothetical protein